MGSTWFQRLSDLGNVVNVENFLSMPTSDLTVTISFAGMKLVELSVSLTRESTSLEKMMGPIGNLMTQVTSSGFQRND